LKEGDKSTKPEIDRTDLRHILLQSVGADVVRWGYALESLEDVGKGVYDLHFKNGKIERNYHLVVGADRTWSRVRPLITPVQPFYSGVSFVVLNISNPGRGEHADVNLLVGRGSVYAFGDRKSIVGQRHRNNSIRVYAAFSTGDDPTWTKRFEEEPQSMVRSTLLSHFPGWHPILLDFIRLAEDEVTSRPLYMFSVGHKWDSQPGLTLIGDAGHVMTLMRAKV
jgi:2-polyprenyl-6-methoxyphenol hydroxylase-like FAD-dependent oxidoreductase